MTYLAKPKLHHPALPTNALGYTHRDYEGAISTLCAGCGHDSISAAIIQAFFELDIAPHRVAKLSGIGCSSKTPTYFLGNSHGFNSVHGRMPSVLTGAALANRDLIYLGVSGDGDSASIGLGQFAHVHAARRQHGLHRREQRRLRPHQGPVLGHRRQGQQEQARRGQQRRADRPRACSRSRSARRSSRAASPATRTQLVPLIKAAVAHHGAAFIDVVSPCVAFNNHPGLDQELRLRARAQRSGQPPRLHARRARRSRPSYAAGRACASVDAARRRHRCACASCTTTTIRRTRSRRMAYLEVAARRAARSSPVCCTCARTAPTCTTRWRRSSAPLNALVGRRARPGKRRARRTERVVALTRYHFPAGVS